MYVLIDTSRFLVDVAHISIFKVIYGFVNDIYS
jgi:hypothetical protein